MAPTYQLYSYFRSSCSARVRIAAHLKGLDIQYVYINLVRGEQSSQSYTQVNPSNSVPTLIVTHDDGTRVMIRQSIAILEYLEESRPDLLSLMPPPSQPDMRAKVRELVNIIACDTQPVTNLRILNRVEASGISRSSWAKDFMTKGLAAYEEIAKTSAGLYSVGDTVSMADLTLAPAVDGAIRFGVDILQFPTVQRVYTTVQQMDSFRKGGWRMQTDTPEELRA